MLNALAGEVAAAAEADPYDLYNWNPYRLPVSGQMVSADLDYVSHLYVELIGEALAENQAVIPRLKELVVDIHDAVHMRAFVQHGEGGAFRAVAGNQIHGIAAEAFPHMNAVQLSDDVGGVAFADIVCQPDPQVIGLRLEELIEDRLV